MFELKRISPNAIPRALAKAERYRLLNQPREAESICLDVLRADRDNREALVTLLLALTDQFSESPGMDIARPKEILGRLRDPYEQRYYAGIIFERWGRALLGKAVPIHIGLGWIREALRAYDVAADISPGDNEDAVLRWNACVRIFQQYERRGPPRAEVSLTSEPDLDDEVPLR